MPDLTALNTFAAYWVLATWVVGALVISLGFGMALIALGRTAIDHWGESLAHYQTALWVHSAMRAHERAGHPRPDKSRTIDEKTKLQRMASALTAAAQRDGFVITIETTPMRPLAMGHYFMQTHVREARSAQPAQAGADRAGG